MKLYKKATQATLHDVDLPPISTNFVLDMDMTPCQKSLLSYKMPIILTPNSSDKIKVLDDAITNPQAKEFIIKRYQGAILPVF